MAEIHFVYFVVSTLFLFMRIFSAQMRKSFANRRSKDLQAFADGCRLSGKVHDQAGAPRARNGPR